MPCICVCGIMISPTCNKHGDQAMQVDTPVNADGLNGVIQKGALLPFVSLFSEEKGTKRISSFLLPFVFLLTSRSLFLSFLSLSPSLSFILPLSLALLLYLVFGLQVPLQQNTAARGTSIPVHILILSFFLSSLLFFSFLSPLLFFLFPFSYTLPPFLHT